MNFSQRSLFLLLATLILCAPAIAAERACAFRQGPSVEGNIYEPAEWPVHLTEADFVRPGIVRPGHDHFYLYIAWRALRGQALTPQQRQRMAPFDPCWVTAADDAWGYDASQDPALVAALAQWNETRASVIPAAPAAPVFAHHYDSANCHADAFRNAARVLASRIASFGKGPATSDWIAAQDAVFASCSAKADLPKDAPADAPAWLRADRAYQQAAAALYRGDYPDAARRFDAIGAPYLAARADLRAGDPAAMARARTRLEPLAQAADDSAMRTDARRLLQMLQLRTEPAVLLASLEQRLAATDPGPSIGQDVRDYALAYRNGNGSARADLGFAGWLSALRGTGIDARQAMQKWRETREPPWLVAALTLATTDSSDLAQLRADALRLPVNSPAFVSARYHLARLSADGALTALPPVSLSAQDANAFRRIGLAHARSLADVARFAPRTNAMASEVQSANALDRDGAALINSGLTLDMQVSLLRMKALPPALRQDLAVVIWTRAFILDRPQVAANMAGMVKAAIPAAAQDIDNMLVQTDPAQRRALGALLLARFPGMVADARFELYYTVDPATIALPNMHRQTAMDDSRDNWWYAFAGGKSGYGEASAAPPAPRFLSRAQRKTLAAERAALAATPNGADYLASLVMAYAHNHPRDPHLAPALATLIRACGGAAQGALTGAMFRHLHRYFPGSEAARRTPTHH
ncbi:MAG: hypothetical protein V4484_08755 [Pseudomonadota bacterium]